MHMKSTIDIDHFAGGEGQQVLANGDDGFADVFGQAPAADGGKALIENQVVVFVFDHGGEVGGDDAGADFVDVDAIFGQSIRPQRCHHAHARLADAVFGAGGGAGISADRADVDDFGSNDHALFDQADHVVGDTLGEEKRPLQIDRHDFVITGNAGVEDVGADTRGDAGIVDQHVDAAEFRQRGIDQHVEAVEIAGVGLHDQGVATCFDYIGTGLLGGGAVAVVVDDDTPALLRPGPGQCPGQSPGCCR